MALVFNDRQAWLRWRANGLGSSDAAVIMGVDLYRNRQQLWEEKLNPSFDERPKNWAMEMGVKLEPIARAKFNHWYREQMDDKITFDAMNVEHFNRKYLKASLDLAYGHEKVNVFGEIKFQGKYDYIYNHVPDKNFWQVQHQFMVTGAKVGYFVGINRWEEIKVLIVEPDPQAIADLYKESEKFWDCVVNRISPGDVF